MEIPCFSTHPTQEPMIPQSNDTVQSFTISFYTRYWIEYTLSDNYLEEQTLNIKTIYHYLFSSVQLLSCVRLFAIPWIAARQASLSITNSQTLLKLMSIWSVMPSNHLILCRPLLLPASGSIQKSQLFASGGQSIGVSASASALTMNTQGWSPLGWTGWISLQSKGLSRVFSNTTVQKHQFSSTQISYSSTFTSIHDYWKNHSLE